MADDRILYAIRNETCFLKLIGEAKYNTTVGFGTFINDLFDREKISSVLVDLSETTYIDSTNLGELTKISSFLREHEQGRPTIVSSNEEINAVITGLGLDRVFVIVDESHAPDVSMKDMPEVDVSEREQARQILEAHKFLMETNEKTGEVFRNVVDAFQKQLDECSNEDEAPLIG